MSLILAIVNQKGGVGKTTTTVNLAYYLASKGKKTLIVDLDPQGNTTSGLGIEKEKIEVSTYDILINDENVRKCITSTGRYNLDIIPSNINLAGAEIELVNFKNRDTALSNSLDTLKKEYDYILIDCPPSLGLLTISGLVASDGIIIPTQAEYYALEGLTQLMTTLELVNKNMNSRLKIFGILITMYDGRITLAQQVADEVRSHFKELVFEIMIPRNVRLSEAPSHGLTIEEYDRKSKGADAYYHLSMEVIKRAKKFK